MDVLPAIPDVAAPPTGIELTDKQLLNWQPSDPIAYSNWFKGQMALQFARRREAMATEMRKSIDAIPDWEVKTSLQRVVQILKRHRDLYFLGDPEDRTPSILITTLAAHAYDGEEDLLEATLSALHKMPDFIEIDARGNGVVVSPVSNENFADKWAEYPEREEKFRSWMEQATEDIEVSANLRGIENVTGRLAKGFGEHVIREATKQSGIELHESSEAGQLGVAGAVAGLSTAAHATRGPKHTFYGREHFGQ